MKIRLAVSRQRYPEVEQELLRAGLEIDENGEFTLSENDRYADRLSVRDPDTGRRIFLPVDEIQLIQSFGHNLEVETRDRSYQMADSLYRVLDGLDPEAFLRISNSVIIATGKVRRISPTFSMKFILTMENGKKVDVTRSYYYAFKERFGI